VRRREKKKNGEKDNQHAYRRVKTISTIAITNETLAGMVTEKRKHEVNLALGKAREIKRKKNGPQEVSHLSGNKFQSP